MSAYTDYFAAVKACSEEAQNALMTVWRSVDFSNPPAARDMLLQTLPAIVDTYGGATAEAAAEMYEAVLFAELNITRNVPIAEISVDGMESSVRYAAGSIFDGDPSKAFDILRKALDYYVKLPARNTVEENVIADKKLGARYARVPQGDTTCEFCVMLASRGFVYRSKKSADPIEGRGGYHTDCDCLPVVSFKDDPVVEGYDPDYYYDLYQQMQDKDKWNKARRKNKGDAKDQ